MRASIPHRILVAGTSGSGKSTLARRIAAALDIPYVEIDSLNHGPRWEPRPSFVEDVDDFTSGERWVIEWQYRSVRPLLVERAQLMVWLDLPRRTVMRRVVQRTVSRRIRRTEIWNGNREGPLRECFTDRDHIIRWAWRTHGHYPTMVADVAREHPHLELVRLRSPREVEAWIRALEGA